LGVKQEVQFRQFYHKMYHKPNKILGIGMINESGHNCALKAFEYRGVGSFDM